MPAKPLSLTASLLSIFGISLIWGYHWAVMKIGLYYCGALTYSALRCVIGGLALLLIVKLRGGSLRVASLRAVMLVGIVQTAGNFGLGAIAVKFGEAGRSAVLTYTMPFWVLVVGYLFLHDRAGPRRWIAASVALVGTLLVAFAGGKAQLGPVLLAIAAGFVWGTGILLYQQSLRKYGDDPTVFAGWQLLVGGIFMALFIPVMPGEGTIQLTLGFILPFLYTVVLATGVAVYVWFQLLARLEAGTVSIGILLAPAIGLASSWIQLGERPPPIEALGLVIILAAIAFFAWAEWRRAHVAKLA